MGMGQHTRLVQGVGVLGIPSPHSRQAQGREYHHGLLMKEDPLDQLCAIYPALPGATEQGGGKITLSKRHLKISFLA